MSLTSFLLGRVKDAAAGVSLNSSAEDVLKLLREFGVADEAQADNALPYVDGALRAARMISKDPSESIMSFVQNGGFLKLLAGPQAQSEGEMTIGCPHCQKPIFLNVQ